MKGTCICPNCYKELCSGDVSKCLYCGWSNQKIILRPKKDNTYLEDKLSDYCIKLQQENKQLKAIIKEAREHVINSGVNTLMGGHKNKLLNIFNKVSDHYE
jgi:hypothetical protein